MPSKEEFEQYLKDIGRKFKNLRKKKGRKITTVALETEIPSTEIDNIEQGKSSQYELKKLYALCSYYGVDPMEFLSNY